MKGSMKDEIIVLFYFEMFDRTYYHYVLFNLTRPGCPTDKASPPQQQDGIDGKFYPAGGHITATPVGPVNLCCATKERNKVTH